MAKAGKPMTKSEVMATIAEDCELSKKQVAAVFDALSQCIKCGLGGPGSFVLPGLLKIEKKDVPARPARYGVPNPFKPGETMDVAAKPASTKVKVRALKNLQDMV